MTVFKAILVTFLLFSIGVILSLGFQLLIHQIDVNPEFLFHYNATAKLVTTLLQYCIPLFIIFKLSYSTNALKAKAENIKWKVLLLVLITSIGFELFNHIFLDTGLLISPKPSHQIAFDKIEYMSKYLYIFDLVRAVIVVPILEELFFRKLLFSRLSKKYSFAIAAVVSSLCFTFIHIPNWFNLVPVFLFGMICCFIYAKTKNILYPIFLHFTVNLIAFLPSFYTQDSFRLGQQLNYNWGYWSILVLGIGLTLFGLRRISQISPA